MPFQANLNPPAAIAPGCLVQGRSGLTGPLSCRNTASHRCIACRHGCRALPLHPLTRAGFNAPPCLPACVCLPFGHPPFRFMGALRPPCALFPDFSRGTRLCIGAKKSTRTSARNGAAIRVLRIRGFDSPSVGMIQIRSAGRSRCFLSAPAGAPCCRAQYSAFCVGCQITVPAQWHQ